MRIAAGLGVGQVTVYACTPLVARLYDPISVGRGGIFLAATNVAGTVAALRYEAQLAACDNAMARWVTRQGALSASALSTLSIVLWAWFSGSLVEGVLFGITTLAIAAIAFLTQWAARLALMNGVATSKGLQGIVQAGAQVAFGTAGWRAMGMQLGFALGYVTSAFAQVLPVLRTIRQLPRRHILPHERRNARRSSAGLTFASVLNLGTVWSQLFLLQLLYDHGSSGQFTIAQRLAIAPAGLVVAVLMPSVVSAAGTHLREGTSAWPVVSRYLKGLVPFSLVVNLLVIAIPTSWVIGLLGPEWADVKSFLLAMSPLTFGLVAVGPVNQLMAISGHTKTQIAWDLSRASSVFCVGYLTHRLDGGALEMVFTTSVTLLTFYLLYLVLLHAHLKEPTP